MNEQRARILIAGGGIGGLTAAIALGRKGFSVRVLEEADEYRLIGAGITIQVNAMQALRHIGIADEVAAAGNVLNRLVLRFSSGQVIVNSDMQSAAEEYGVPFIAIHRARLQHVLFDAAGSDNIAFAFHVEKYDEDPGGVLVTGENIDQEYGDALIGADGLRSIVRQQLWGDESLRYSGYTSWRGLVANDGLVPSDEGAETWGEKSVFGMIPLADDQLYWFATHRAQPGGQDADDPRETILSLTGHWH